MIEEAYVSFETAKLLKEKGFDVSCYGRYSVRSKEFHLDTTKPCNNGGISQYSAPSQQMAMKWLREVHNIHIQIMLDGWALGSHSGFYILLMRMDNDFELLNPLDDEVFFETYEEAVEAALKYCLENLI